MAGDVQAQKAVVAENVQNLYVGADGKERPVPFAAPRPPDPFVGRKDAVDKIVEHLIADEPSSAPLALTALDGGPGVGKTSLARAVAWDPRIEKHFKHGVLWAELGPEGNVESELDKWGALIGLEMSAFNDTPARSQALQSWLHNQKALLIIDDVWDTAKAKPFLVGGPHCRAIITTRKKSIADDLAQQNPTHVDPLKPKDGLDLLRRLAPKAVAEDEGAARRLAKALDGLPLGIELAGRLLRRRTRAGRGASTVLSELTDREKRLEAGDEAKRSLRAVIGLSYDNLPDDQPKACFRALGLFGAKPMSFSFSAARAVWDTDEAAADDLIVPLVESGMVEIEEGDPVRYTLHATIADFAESLLAKHDEAATIADRRHQFYVALARETPQNEWKTLLPEIQQLDQAFQWTVERSDGEMADEILLAADDFLTRQGLWGTNTAWQQHCLRFARDRGDRGREAVLLNNEGFVHDNRGEWDKALETYEQSRRIQEEIGDRGGLATTLSNIGVIHDKRGEWDKALETYEQSRRIKEEIGDRGGLATTLNNIGMIHSKRGEWEKALETYEQSRRIQEEIGDRGGLAATLNNIGMIHSKRGEWDKALETYEQSRRITEEIGDRGVLTVTLFNIARIYEDRERYSDALPLLERVVELDEQMGHPDLESDREVLERVRRKAEGS